MENNDDIKELIIARLEVLPDNKSISIGSNGDFTKQELIEHVKTGDSLGRKITEIQMEYLRLLKGNFLYEQNIADNQTEA